MISRRTAEFLTISFARLMNNRLVEAGILMEVPKPLPAIPRQPIQQAGIDWSLEFLELGDGTWRLLEPIVDQMMSHILFCAKGRKRLILYKLECLPAAELCTVSWAPREGVSVRFLVVADWRSPVQIPPHKPTGMIGRFDMAYSFR